MIDICSQSRSLGFSETPIAAHTYALDAQELRSNRRSEWTLEEPQPTQQQVCQIQEQRYNGKNRP